MRNGWSQDAEIEERKTTERHNERRGVRGAKREPLEARGMPSLALRVNRRRTLRMTSQVEMPQGKGQRQVA